MTLLLLSCAAHPPRHIPAEEVRTCFYDFTEVYQKRVYDMLARAPGMTAVDRLWKACEGYENCLCYRCDYAGRLEELEGWIRKELRTSIVVPFRLIPRGGRELEIVFDGGFN